MQHSTLSVATVHYAKRTPVTTTIVRMQILHLSWLPICVLHNMCTVPTVVYFYTLYQKNIYHQIATSMEGIFSMQAFLSGTVHHTVYFLLKHLHLQNVIQILRRHFNVRRAKWMARFAVHNLLSSYLTLPFCQNIKLTIVVTILSQTTTDQQPFEYRLRYLWAYLTCLQKDIGNWLHFSLSWISYAVFQSFHFLALSCL